MISYTNYQKNVLRQLRLSKVVWRDMWKTEHELGYSSKGRRSYEINVAKDYPNSDVREIVLLHELGHQIYGHLDQVDLKKEFSDIKTILEKKDLPFSALRYYGGPHCFVNIAMDCYINSTLLTKSNCDLMYKENLEICTPSHFGFKYQGDFRSYYEPLIDRIEEKMEEKVKENEDSNDQMNGDSDFVQTGMENGDVLPDSMKDLPNTVSSFEEGLDEDISDEIKEENYSSGNDKSNQKNVSVVNTVEETIESPENIGSKTSGAGPYHYNGNVCTIKSDESYKEIKNFLSKIVSSNNELENDAIRLYNHGTRRNSSGVLYSSMKRKHNFNRKKLGILIDCSGSMDSSSLIKAINSLKDSMNLISDDSIVVAWDEDVCGEWNINKLPSYVPEGGCTEMSTGVKYLIDKDCNSIIVFSDFGTDMYMMNNSLEKYTGEIYSIIVTNGYNTMKDDISIQYLKKNTDYINIKG